VVPNGEQAVPIGLAASIGPRLGGLDRGITHQAAAATIGSPLGRIADAVTDPAAQAERAAV